MFIARWQIDARFGHKQEVLELMKEWERDIGASSGLDLDRSSFVTGSIGALEATIENNLTVESLAELERFFETIGKNPAHAAWGKKLEPHVVSGTSRWSIFRVVPMH
ncbi:hypothetical protein K32_18290 [Kaistia sp. 32K]|uniref:hypothetical protein n=1 Tax=Kaistia sp. 32K TaxID=2795690 RepID=UPI001915AFC1|nr:hypothetical protein [Kaistia sp. 32K]BCP53212.1 hypothetical protein K32_18290 [Kaistia sp. 32K]